MSDLGRWALHPLSPTYALVLEKYGFTVDNVVAKAKALLGH